MRKDKRIILLILGLGGVLLFRECREIIYENLNYYDHEDLGANFEYFPDKKIILGMNGPISIPPIVEEYKVDERFIVAKQFPNGRNPDSFFDMKRSDYYLGLDSMYYWIIDKDNKYFYGPMDYGRFLSLCDSLNVGLLL